MEKKGFEIRIRKAGIDHEAVTVEQGKVFGLYYKCREIHGRILRELHHLIYIYEGSVWYRRQSTSRLT